MAINLKRYITLTNKKETKIMWKIIWKKYILHLFISQSLSLLPSLHKTCIYLQIYTHTSSHHSLKNPIELTWIHRNPNTHTHMSQFGNERSYVYVLLCMRLLYFLYYLKCWSWIVRICNVVCVCSIICIFWNFKFGFDFRRKLEELGGFWSENE